MMPDTLENRLVPTLRQLGRFWVFRRRKLVDAVMHEVQITDKQMNDLVTLRTELTRDLQKREKELIELIRTCTETNQQLQQKCKDLAAFTQAHEQTRKQYDTLTKELDDRKNDLATLTQTYEQTNQQLQGLRERYKLTRQVLAARHQQQALCPIQQAEDDSNLPLASMTFAQWLTEHFIPVLHEIRLPATTSLTDILSQVQNLQAAVELLRASPLLRNKFIVAVAGGFSSGKSSFITSFIKDRQIELPVDIKPTTSIPTYVLAGDADIILGHTYKGGVITIPAQFYQKLTHDFIRSLGFNLRDILPYVTIETTLRGLAYVSFIDLPGYDGARAKDAYIEDDANTSTKFIQHANALIWLVGLDSNGTLPESDLTYLKNLSIADERPLHVIINKADVRPVAQINEILDELQSTLNNWDIPYVGLTAYDSRSGKEIMFRKQNLFEILRQWDHPAEPVIRVLRQFGDLMDQVELIAEQAHQEHESLENTVHSLSVDVLELMQYVPEEESVETQSKISEILSKLFSSDSSNEVSSASSRLNELRTQTEKSLSHLKQYLSADISPDAMRDRLARLRHEGLSFMETYLK